MNLKEITRVLQEIFNKELTEGKKRHIVFWYDEEGEFTDEIDELALDGVRIWRLTENNYFATKYELEKVDLNSHFLIYSAMPKPTPRENWLIDVLKYSTEFSTDRTTVIMRNLGIKEDSLRPVFKKYTKFFKSNERTARFEALNIKNYTEEIVDLAVLSVLCKVNKCSLEEVLKALFKEMLQEEKKLWEAIEKYGDTNAFWNLVEKYYGYNLSDKSLEKLFIFFIVTSLSETLQSPIPETWKNYISSERTNCVVFMDHFMNHVVDKERYDELAVVFEEKMNVKSYIKEWDINDFLQCDLFPIFDETIIERLAAQVSSGIEEFEQQTAVILARRTLHWYSQFKQEYEALYWAIQLLKKYSDIGKNIKRDSTYNMLQRYVTDYYEIDKAYRKFYSAFDRAQYKERLESVQEYIENTYTNGYLDELAIHWSNSVEEELLNGWCIDGIEQQTDFYRTFIQPHLSKDERVFVVISDALRYEAAKELCDQLNIERKASTEITFMQGVIPSFTKLGMASLLPHKNIELDEQMNVIVNGINSLTTANREKILLQYHPDAIAVQYDDIIDMNRKKFRELFSGKKLIYIYHNQIDAKGDHAATEREVFQAVDETIEELKQLINHLVNDLSATNIYITADHGFIYKRGRLQERDKISAKVDNPDVDNRRFIITNKAEHIEGTLTFTMKNLFEKDNERYVIVPRGTNRFKKQGAGANYVHGGVMPQEIVIPVIKFKNDRSKSEKNAVRKVEVRLTNISRKITNMITYLEFFQTEKVEDKKIPLRLKLYFIDEEGNRISNENIIIADSQSANPAHRTYREKFVLRNMQYDKTKKYYLILEDEEETVEKIYEKIPFIIDLAFSSDFGF